MHAHCLALLLVSVVLMPLVAHQLVFAHPVLLLVQMVILVHTLWLSVQPYRHQPFAHLVASAALMVVALS